MVTLLRCRSAIIRHRLRIMMYLFFTSLFKQITHNSTVGTIRNEKYTLHCFKRYFEFLIPMSRYVLIFFANYILKCVWNRLPAL